MSQRFDNDTLPNGATLHQTLDRGAVACAAGLHAIVARLEPPGLFATPHGTCAGCRPIVIDLIGRVDGA
jgi:hypothetical protein